MMVWKILGELQETVNKKEYVVRSTLGGLPIVRCKLFERDGQMMAVTTGTQSSGALRSMVLADGLLILYPEDAPFLAGKRVKVQVMHTNSPLSLHSPYT